MEMPDLHPPPKAGFLTRFFIRLVGADEATMRLCPPHDWEVVRAVAAIMICTWIYQAGLLSIISHRLFAPPGQIRPGLVLASMFIATFILLIDSYMIYRSGWHLNGIEELKRGGIDISGGLGGRLKAWIFLAVRIFLSVCIAQLTAIFLSIIIFAADIDARIGHRYLQANAHLLPAATALVDAEIQRATDTVTAETSREATLANQVTTLHQDQIDPSANDPQISQAQQEVTQLLAQKTAADNDLRNAQKFASDELAGIKGSANNSGLQGSGPRRSAALEQVTNATNRAQQVDTDLAAAQTRLDGLRNQAATTDAAKKKRSTDQLPDFQNDLNAEATELAAAKTHLAELTRDRDAAIRAAVENAPDHVGRENGFLQQITELEQIAESDRKIALVILLIDLTSFGFELASVLAKVTSFVPTTYAALLARDAYLSAVRIVDGMMRELSPITAGSKPEMGISQPPPPADAAQRGNGYDHASELFTAPPKRPRGRPRKTVVT